MTKQLWLNIAVQDPKQSLAFYSAIGFEGQPDFSSEVSETVKFNDGTLLMLVQNDFFTQAAKRELADTQTHAEVVLATELESQSAVDDMASKAVENGATEIGEAFAHEGMYTRIFRDLDGHQFNVFAFV